jgi:hypothetical protein
VSLVEAAIEHVIATEMDPDAQGVPIVVRNKTFSRTAFIAAVIEDYMGGPYTELELPPTVLVCTRKDGDAAALRTEVNRSFAGKRHARMLHGNTQPQGVQGVMFGSYGTLRAALHQLPDDAFDLLVVSGQTPREITRFHGMFKKLRPAFTILMLPNSMYEQDELEHWPWLQPPYFAGV